jgi:hypothetical protein
MTRSEDVAHATTEFNLVWQNDQDIYNAVLDYARNMSPRMEFQTDQTLGRNVKDRVFAWCYGGGWGFSEGWGGSTTSLRDDDRYPDWKDGGPPANYRANPFSYFLTKEQYHLVSEEAIAEDVREALGIEGFDPRTGCVIA